MNKLDNRFLLIDYTAKTQYNINTYFYWFFFTGEMMIYNFVSTKWYDSIGELTDELNLLIAGKLYREIHFLQEVVDKEARYPVSIYAAIIVFIKEESDEFIDSLELAVPVSIS